MDVKHDKSYEEIVRLPRKSARLRSKKDHDHKFLLFYKKINLDERHIKS